jgi:hypothetical protein
LLTTLPPNTPIAAHLAGAGLEQACTSVEQDLKGIFAVIPGVRGPCLTWKDLR